MAECGGCPPFHTAKYHFRTARRRSASDAGVTPSGAPASQPRAAVGVVLRNGTLAVLTDQPVPGELTARNDAVDAARRTPDRLELSAAGGGMLAGLPRKGPKAAVISGVQLYRCESARDLTNWQVRKGWAQQSAVEKSTYTTKAPKTPEPNRIQVAARGLPTGCAGLSVTTRCVTNPRAALEATFEPAPPASASREARVRLASRIAKEASRWQRRDRRAAESRLRTKRKLAACAGAFSSAAAPAAGKQAKRRRVVAGPPAVATAGGAALVGDGQPGGSGVSGAAGPRSGEAPAGSGGPGSSHSTGGAADLHKLNAPAHSGNPCSTDTTCATDLHNLRAPAHSGNPCGTDTTDATRCTDPHRDEAPASSGNPCSTDSFGAPDLDNVKAPTSSGNPCSTDSFGAPDLDNVKAPTSSGNPCSTDTTSATGCTDPHRDKAPSASSGNPCSTGPTDDRAHLLSSVDAAAEAARPAGATPLGANLCGSTPSSEAPFGAAICGAAAASAGAPAAPLSGLPCTGERKRGAEAVRPRPQPARLPGWAQTLERYISCRVAGTRQAKALAAAERAKRLRPPPEQGPAAAAPTPAGNRKGQSKGNPKPAAKGAPAAAAGAGPRAPAAKKKKTKK
ncbi:hypothetical protein DIPPA_06148 [Diplonema papillatum]|nr:hypothetical protein DIPPA_06148 [Diplonema papillatum]